MPEKRVFQYFFPRTDAGQRRIHEHEPLDAITMLGCKRKAHHIANIMGHEINLAHL